MAHGVYDFQSYHNDSKFWYQTAWDTFIQFANKNIKKLSLYISRTFKNSLYDHHDLAHKIQNLTLLQIKNHKKLRN